MAFDMENSSGSITFQAKCFFVGDDRVGQRPWVYLSTIPVQGLHLVVQAGSQRDRTNELMSGTR